MQKGKRSKERGHRPFNENWLQAPPSMADGGGGGKMAFRGDGTLDDWSRTQGNERGVCLQIHIAQSHEGSDQSKKLRSRPREKAGKRGPRRLEKKKPGEGAL